MTTFLNLNYNLNRCLSRNKTSIFFWYTQSAHSAHYSDPVGKKNFGRFFPEKYIVDQHINMAMSSTQTELEEPAHLCCPITYQMFRDPVMVCRSVLPDISIVTNVLARKCVEEWLNDNPGRIPVGWESRKVPAAHFDHGGKRRTVVGDLRKIFSVFCHYLFWIHLAFITLYFTIGFCEEIDRLRKWRAV